MCDSKDIQNILQTGYFTTSRARSSYSFVLDIYLAHHLDNDSQDRSSTESLSRPVAPPVSDMSRRISRFFSRKPRHRRSYPPPPSVEDEVVSLAREYGASATPVSEEEARSRGEIDQQPILLEVHEHNPERRFVFLPASSKASDSGAEDSASDNQARRKTKPKEQLPVESANGQNHDGESIKRLNPDNDIPSLGRRSSRQDLPQLQTEVEHNQTPTHYRSKSAASALRSEFPIPSHSRTYGADFLSPDITKHGVIGRDKGYSDYRQTPTSEARSATQSNIGDQNDARCDSKHHRRSVTSSTDGRSSSTTFETSRRPIPNDRSNVPPRRGDRSPRADAKECFEPYRPGAGGESMKIQLPNKSRENSGPGDESFHRRVNSTIIGDDRDPSRLPRIVCDGARNARAPSRTRTMPAQSINPTEFPDDRISIPRTVTTFPIDRDEGLQERWKTQLPYPDDDDTHGDWQGVPGRNLQPESASIMSMPHIPPVIDGVPIQSDSGLRIPSPSTAPTSVSWKHPALDPDGDGARSNRPVGSYRRYSENKGQDGQQSLPEIPQCTRIVPVAGKMDWLTLPRTDFNICPDCYGAVFADTEYRTHFQPILRPTSSPIACDFGSSPWYRIAWLLTLKHQMPDLQLFYLIANITSAPHNEPCPSDRKAVRNWYTVKDPYTRRPVPDFTVCYQCAKMVETLLPNLTGVFVPLDLRLEPTRSICALHFAPERKQFVLFFDAFETNSDQAFMVKRQPDIGDLSISLARLSTLDECREDRRVEEGYWYMMEFLPEFTVCGECYESAVRPQHAEGNPIAQNFYMKPQKLPVATCQLYSSRMKDVFKRACRRNDFEYLEEKVQERLNMEKILHAKFLALLRTGRNDAWTDEQIDKLSREWKKWE